MMEINLYCDGGSRSKTNISAYCGIVSVNGNEILTSTKKFGKATNNQMELLGFINTLKEFLENLVTIENLESIDSINLKVISDSQYLIRGVNEYLPNWSTNGWKAYNKKPIKNIDEWKTIYKIVTEISEKINTKVIFHFIWTKGHVVVNENSTLDTLYNNKCDDLLNITMDDDSLETLEYNNYIKEVLDYFNK